MCTLLVVVMAAPLEKETENDQLGSFFEDDLVTAETKINSVVARFLRKMLKKPKKLFETVIPFLGFGGDYEDEDDFNFDDY